MIYLFLIFLWCTFQSDFTLHGLLVYISVTFLGFWINSLVFCQDSKKGWSRTPLCLLIRVSQQQLSISISIRIHMLVLSKLKNHLRCLFNNRYTAYDLPCNHTLNGGIRINAKKNQIHTNTIRCIFDMFQGLNSLS